MARDLLAAVLAVMFFAAAGSKAVAQRRSDVPVLPGLHNPVLVWILVVVEFATGAMLLIAPKPGAIVAGILLVAFTIALVVLRRTHPGEPCRCFGSLSQQPVAIKDFVRNLAMLAACLWILLV